MFTKGFWLAVCVILWFILCIIHLEQQDGQRRRIEMLEFKVKLLKEQLEFQVGLLKEQLEDRR